MHLKISLSLSYTHAQFAAGIFLLFSRYIRMYSERANAHQRRVRTRSDLRPLKNSRSSLSVRSREPGVNQTRDLRQCLSGHGFALRSLQASSGRFMRSAQPFSLLYSPSTFFPPPTTDVFPTPLKNRFPHLIA